jgi:hypothetical protein
MEILGQLQQQQQQHQQFQEPKDSQGILHDA